MVLLAGLLICGRSTALAADSASPFDWTGPDVGLHIGYGWGDADTTFSPRPTAARFFDLAPKTLSPGPDGIAGGLQAGYSYQMGCFVFGVEADFSGSGMGGTKTVSPIIKNNGTPFPGGGLLGAHQETNWFGTVRPRLGYTVVPSLLLYGSAWVGSRGTSPERFHSVTVDGVMGFVYAVCAPFLPFTQTRPARCIPLQKAG